MTGSNQTADNSNGSQNNTATNTTNMVGTKKERKAKPYRIADLASDSILVHSNPWLASRYPEHNTFQS
ncbi:hypothetical protein COCNU_07G007250 [Cocos nucifera]|uniref:Uncharacterized protein n=1 Tax=Cocos nucifera TaxID=13894 RepID=A0A8K0IG58_COCNU|nr:hypothetical protein COCNU_07G007250 [Cocos nucifera]